MTGTVIFDAFGTLLRITEGVHPYRQILKEGIRRGRRPKPDDAHVLMTQNLGLKEVADHLGIPISPDHMAELQRALDHELEGIQTFDDGLQAVALLQGAGVKVAVCSNLAAPYAEPIHRWYPSLNAYGFSFEIGAVKPDALIYRRTCQLLGITGYCDFNEGRVKMIGDSARCDRDGARESGIQGYLLDRTGDGDFSNLLDFAQEVLLQH